MAKQTKPKDIQKELYSKYTAQMSEVNATEFKKRIKYLMKDYQHWVTRNYVPNWRFDRNHEYKVRVEKENDSLKRELSQLKSAQRLIKAASHNSVNSKLNNDILSMPKVEEPFF